MFSDSLYKSPFLSHNITTAAKQSHAPITGGLLKGGESLISLLFYPPTNVPGLPESRLGRINGATHLISGDALKRSQSFGTVTCF